MEDILNKAREEEAISFGYWLNKEGWQEYDEPDRWICPSNNRNVYTTKQVYEKFKAERLSLLNR